ncbi:PREDICTED: protein disabled [Polistes dominula]|uniref:Protein disabled n=1 Tax=Polistes dominula TaxID=743375 RepID=A0ABM1HXC6_POLDO|nr:PREDICTED: protein disabled [Polistes dominula]
MQTLRKKNSPCKFKNEPTRFLGDGVSFKAKLIGILEVSEARGDRMCQAALADLKMAIRAAGEHKQRIVVQVSIDGLRLRDEKSSECLYHHPVHKISFIAQDMSDSRAFGYIFGSPDTGHRFFGIKTDKSASQVVVAMRDLFQVVFELKKKEIELAKQQIEQNAINAIKFHPTGMFVEPAPDTKGAAGTESSSLHRTRITNSETEKSNERKAENQSGDIADLLDLQFELNSLQQGIHQMDKITPEQPGPTADDLFESDPFGDSFANMKLKDTVQPILPPPPSSSKRGHLERQQTVPAPTTSATSSPATTLYSKTPPPQDTIHWFDKETENLFNDGELTSLTKSTTPGKKEQEETSLNTTPRSSQAKSPQIDVFTELDPLGTGLIKPYVDKKDFFQHLKNPPKKEGDRHEEGNFANFDRFDENEAMQSSILPKADSPQKKDILSRPTTHHQQPLSVSLPPEDTPNKSTFSGGIVVSSVNPTNVGGVSTSVVVASKLDKDSNESIQTLVKLPSPKKYLQSVRKREFDIELSGNKSQSIEKSSFPVDFSTTTSESPASPLRSCSSDANSRLSSSSAELDLVPEPPPRGVGSIMINPPPLPPKKQTARGAIKPPPRPPYTTTDGHFHYDFIVEREESSPSPTRIKERKKSPSRDNKSQFDDNFSPPPSQISNTRTDLISTMTTSAFEDSFSSMIPTTNLSTFFTSTGTPAVTTKKPKPSLDITLSQLTSANLVELASSLGMTVQELTSLTLQQLTECLANLSSKESSTIETKEEKPVQPKTEPLPLNKQSSTCKIAETSFVSGEPLFKANFDQEPMKKEQEPTYDKYAVFRELLEMEQMLEESKEERNDEEIIMTDTEPKEPCEEPKESDDKNQNEILAEAIVAMVNLTVKLPPSNDELIKEETGDEEIEETNEIENDKPIEPMEEIDEIKDNGIEVSSMNLQSNRKIDLEVELETEADIEVDIEDDMIDDTIMVVGGSQDKSETLSDKGSEVNGISDKVIVDNADETGRSSVTDKTEERYSTSTSNDRYAALREIFVETERRNKQMHASSLAESELLSLFSDNLPATTVPTSPKKSVKKKDDDLKTVAMDIFEEIKMLNTGTATHVAKDVKVTATTTTSGFEDVFCPFTDDNKDNREDVNKEDGNWAKFETSMIGSDRSSCEGTRSVGGTSPWSPDGKDFHRDIPPFKPVSSTSAHRHSGDSDNEWKDEEESEESNGRGRIDGRFWFGRHPRFDAAEFDERSFYEEATGPVENRSDKRDRSFRGRAVRKSRGPWAKNVGYRPREPSQCWHENTQQWEEGPRICYHRKLICKDTDDHYDPRDHMSRFWKCRAKSQRWNWIQDDAASFYNEERERNTERKLTLFYNEEDRFGSEESVGYDDDDRWSSRRKYQRRQWDEEFGGRFWSRRSSPPDGEYPSKESYYYYHGSRERPHDYVGTWDEEYGPDRAVEESGRYNTTGRKRHWPKRPNSANEGRNTEYGEMVYTKSRNKFGTSRSECSDNDSDPYLRPSQRSRSREIYWGSDQEYDSWPERPYWSEGPDGKSETLHRKRVVRHKGGRQQVQVSKTQSPFEDDFAQSIEQIESPAAPVSGESLTPTEPRVVHLEVTESKRELIDRPPLSPSSITTATTMTATTTTTTTTTTTRSSSKDVTPPRREIQHEYNKRSSMFEDDLTPSVPNVSSPSVDVSSDRRRLSSDLKATPEEISTDTKDTHRSLDGFVTEASNNTRDSFFNGDLRFDDEDAFTFKSELEDSVPERCTTTLSLKNTRQNKYVTSNSNNKGRPSDQYIRKSESVNIFIREEDPFDDDDFFN